MGTRLARLWNLLTSVDLVMALLWLGLAAFTITLVVLIWTRWGQYRPLRKCLLLSLLVHLLLAGYATTIEIVSLAPTDESVVRVSFVEGPVGPGSGPGDPEASPSTAMLTSDEPSDGVSAPAAMVEPPHADATNATTALPSAAPAVNSGASVPPLGSVTGPSPSAGVSRPSASDDRTRGEWIVAAVSERYLAAAADDPPAPEGSMVIGSPQLPSRRDLETSSAGGSQAGPSDGASSQGTGQRAVPEVYRLRTAPDHGLAQGGGGSPETEAAVRSALTWMVSRQSPDGRWDASENEAGRESVNMIDGHNRRGAGVEADTGMTGLALLSFLASGHTHLRGDHQESVRRGLEYLLQSQGADGSLGGKADFFAAMYCHAMATFALSEAYGMTGDDRLREPLRRAIGYTIASQDSRSGGWRYRPGDAGDTSQLGWQFMALKSAEMAGIPTPERTRDGIVRYLRSVSSGRSGGLASYRPGEAVTRTMSAEAMLCWQFLGLGRDHPASTETAEYLLGDLPSRGRVNIYYWYYATLTMHQLQGDRWQQWNEALRTELLATQHKTGELEGTWDPDPLWGRYGGRVYSTSLATLCLEVYYRYLPLYTRVASRSR